MSLESVDQLMICVFHAPPPLAPHCRDAGIQSRCAHTDIQYIAALGLDRLLLNDLTLWRKPYINLLFFWPSVIRLGWGVSNAMVAIYQTTGLLRLRINGCSRHKQTNKTGGLMNTARLPSGNRGVEGKWWRKNKKRRACCRQRPKPPDKRRLNKTWNNIL